MATSDARAGAGRSRSALVSYALLAVYVVALLAGSWQRWGNPLGDTGLDLTVAAGWLDGIEPYRDVRYWYGPLGLGVLTAAFAILGTHLWVAMAVGLAQTAVIAELTRRLARRWLPVPATVGAVAVVLAIGFGGKGANFQMPHTFAATAGVICLLLTLLALSRERFALAGLAVGAAALTRPEFLAFAVAAVGGAAFGAWKAHGFPSAVRGAALSIATTLLVAVPVLGWFGVQAGLHRVLFENIVPLEFLRALGPDLERDQHPLDLFSLAMLCLRGAFIVFGSWVVVAAWSAIAARREDRPGGLPAGSATLLKGVASAVVVGFACAALAGQATEPIGLVKSDVTRFLIAMTALPAIGLGLLVVAAIAWLRGRPSPLDVVAGPAAVEPAGEPLAEAGSPATGERTEGRPGWVAGGALIAAAAACSLRSYNSFSTDVYAPYFAPPVVLVAAIVLHRFATGRTLRASLASAVVLAMAAASLSLHAYVGLYRDYTASVRTPAGTFKADAEAGPLMQQAFDLLDGRLKPGDRLLTMPQEPGFVFLTGARPALYDATFLPGVLATAEDDEAAARALITGAGVPRYARPAAGQPYRPPRFVIETNWNFAQWGARRQGEDVNVALHRAVVEHYRVIGRFGDTVSLPDPLDRGEAFTVYELK